jgi:dienelactone hydrolase
MFITTAQSTFSRVPNKSIPEWTKKNRISFDSDSYTPQEANPIFAGAFRKPHKKNPDKTVIRPWVKLTTAGVLAVGGFADLFIPGLPSVIQNQNATLVNDAQLLAAKDGAALPKDPLFLQGVFGTISPQEQARFLHAALHDVPGVQFVNIPSPTPGFAIQTAYVPPQPGHSVIVWFPGADNNPAIDRPFLLRLIKAGYGIATCVQPVKNAKGQFLYQAQDIETAFLQNAKAVSAFIAKQGLPVSQQIIGGRSIGGGLAVKLGNQAKAVLIVNTPTDLESFSKGWTANESNHFVHWFLNDVYGWNIKDALKALKNVFNMAPSLTKLADQNTPILVVNGSENHSGGPDTHKLANMLQGRGFPVTSYILPGATHDNITNSGATAANKTHPPDPESNPHADQLLSAFQDWVTSLKAKSFRIE